MNRTKQSEAKTKTFSSGGGSGDRDDGDGDGDSRVGWLENQNLFQGHVSFYSIYFIHIYLSSRYICRHFLSQLERSGVQFAIDEMLKTIPYTRCAQSVCPCKYACNCKRWDAHTTTTATAQDSNSYSIETTITEKLRPGKCVCVVRFFSFLKHFCFRCRLEIEQKPKIISFFVFVHLTTGPSISNVAIFEHQKFSTSRATSREHLFFIYCC